MLIKGRRLSIQFFEPCPSGSNPGDHRLPESWDEAIVHFPKDKESSLKAKFFALAKRLADHAQLRSPDKWNKEGKLPNGKDFYAIKPDKKLRAYGWYSSKHKSTFVISHFAFKDGEKLSKSNEDRVGTNWRTFEGPNEQHG